MTILGALGAISQAGRGHMLGHVKVFGPSWRFIGDLSNSTVSAALPGGPSGDRWTGVHYTNGLGDYLANRYTIVSFG